jgi:hypothetical protein
MGDCESTRIGEETWEIGYWGGEMNIEHPTLNIEHRTLKWKRVKGAVQYIGNTIGSEHR